MNDIVAIMRAADFAARKHTKQKRKGEEAEPYLNSTICSKSPLWLQTPLTGVRTSSSPHCCMTRWRIKT
jgi:hypothetical protein